MKTARWTLLLVAALSLVAAPSARAIQPPGVDGEAYEDEFSERAGVDEEGRFDPGVVERDYESDVVFPGEPFDYAERTYGPREVYDTDYYQYDPYLDRGPRGDDFYSDDWFSDQSAFDSWYDGE